MGRADRSQPLEGVRALILGAGGVARAIATGLTQQGALCIITGRTIGRAENLAQQVGGQAVEWETRGSVRCDLVVNCTPIGMHPNVNDTPFPEGLLGHMVVFDTIYNPEQTLLIKQARAAGCAVITGVDMFIRQAALQYQIFTEQKQKAPVEVMRSELMRRTGAAQES
jgi:3-dehydroquinate dehydratase/shikimate dehydrogenase